MVEEKQKKKFSGLLVLNWKNGETRVLKQSSRNRNRDFGPYEIPIEYNINLIIPKTPLAQIKGEIEIPQEKIAEMLLENI